MNKKYLEEDDQFLLNKNFPVQKSVTAQVQHIGKITVDDDLPTWLDTIDAVYSSAIKELAKK